MHFISTKSELIKAISIASRATSKIQKTILECIMFDCKNDKVSLRATDISLSIDTAFNAEIIEEGCVAIPSRFLLDIISKFSESDVSIKSIDGCKLEVKCMNSVSNLACMDVEGFPSFPDKPEGSYVKIQEGTLKRMLNETIFAASSAEDKPILTGLHFGTENNNLEIAALDGYRMAVRTENVISENDIGFVIPARAAREITHICDDSEDTVKFALSKNMAVFDIDGTFVYTRLLEGEYVKYKNLIPANQTIDIITERLMLKESVERAAVLAREKSNLIRFVIKDNVLEITGTSELGSINEQMPVVQNGENIEIAFNAKDILDVVRALPDDEIKLSFQTALSPCIATNTKIPGYLYLLLPLKG